MTATMTKAEFVQSCLADGGYAERPLGSNNTKFGVKFGWNKVAWCVIYGWCKYLAAGITLPLKTASCVAMYDECVRRGLAASRTSGVVLDAVIRSWQHLARNSHGFDPSQTHFQIILKVKVTKLRRRRMYGLWGGNQGAGYVGPKIEWVPADDLSIMSVLKFSTLFDVEAAKPSAAHDPTKDTNAGMPAAKSHKYPKVGNPASRQAKNLYRRLKGKRATKANRADLEQLHKRLGRVIKRGAKR